jgi:hypothetical protein
VREIYAKGDSAFLAGDLSHNPYMFRLDSEWIITPSDAIEKYNVKTGKTADNIEDFSNKLSFDEQFRPLVAPVETVRKRFGWFYTYYSFKAVYPCISDRIPVSIDKYLNKDEQKLWFRGDFSTWTGMTGLEVKNDMDEMENKFMEWYSQNVREIYFDVIGDFEKQSGNSRYLTQLPAVKDSVFQIQSDDINDVLTLLDKHLKTNHFSDMYKTNKQQIDKMCEERLSEDLFSRAIEYKLIIPGKLISANTPLISRDTLTWKIMAIHLIPDNYELTATSRVTNTWAFAAVVLLLAVSIYCLTKTSFAKKR